MRSGQGKCGCLIEVELFHENGNSDGSTTRQNLSARSMTSLIEFAQEHTGRKGKYHSAEIHLRCNDGSLPLYHCHDGDCEADYKPLSMASPNNIAGFPKRKRRRRKRR